MRDHAFPMKDQMKIWMTTCRTYCRIPPMGMNGIAAMTARHAMPRARAIMRSLPLREDAAGADEHQDDEEPERDDVAHLRRPRDAADGDDLAHDERRHEGAEHV